MGLKMRTAINWIARARAAGHLTRTIDQDAVRRVAIALFESLGVEPDQNEDEYAAYLQSLVGGDNDVPHAR